MPKSANQKLKLLYILKLFKEKTDENHYVTMNDIVEYLAEKEISAERKAIYRDIEALNEFGYDIKGEKIGTGYKYHLASREFELFELKLLVDAVQSSRALTEEKSRELIKKLEAFTSDYNAAKIHKSVIVKNRVKTINEKVYYAMDAVDEAISKNKAIRFEYRRWSVKKELVPKKNAIKENISPWALIWDSDNYYMLGYDPAAQGFKHYRLDKMFNVTIESERDREGRELFEGIDLAAYSNEHFSMYGGEICTVKLECKNTTANFIIDKFGTDISLVPKDDEWFTVNVDVVPSKMFYGWVFSFGEDIRIISPKGVRKEMRERLKPVAKLYKSDN